MTIVSRAGRHCKAGAGGALAALFARPLAAFADDSVETHGLSSFGDLALPPDFPHFAYVNPQAPTGGLLSLQITGTSGNQNFDTFDTLNVYSWKGNGAAGMSATFDTLMTANGDEPDSVYGLLAQIRARFGRQARLSVSASAGGALLRRVAGNRGRRRLLAQRSEGEGPSDLRAATQGGRSPRLQRATTSFMCALSRTAAATPTSSSSECRSSRLPGGSGRDFAAATLDPPLGSGAYKVKAFEQGRFIEFERDPNYWGAKLPVNLGQNNFDRLRFEYYRERQVAFEAFKAGAINYHEEFTSRFWATAYDFPAAKDGRVKKEVLHNGAPVSTQGWYLNTRREQFSDPRVREAIGLAFDFEWTNKNVMYSSYKRIISYFPNTDMEAKGKPGPDELKLLEPFRDKLAPSVFDDPYTPPVSDGSGVDRTLLKQAYDLLLAAGCKRDGGAMMLPNGKPLTIEFLDSSASCSRIRCRSSRISASSGFRRASASSTPRSSRAEPKRSTTMSSPRRFPAPRRQASVCGSSTTSEAAKQNGSRNLAGVADPAVDALIETIAAREIARGPQRRLSRARPRAARGTLLGADVVSRHRLGGLLGRVRTAGAPAEAQHRRAGHLVVGRRKGQGHWTVIGAWIIA